MQGFLLFSQSNNNIFIKSKFIFRYDGENDDEVKVDGDGNYDDDNDVDDNDDDDNDDNDDNDHKPLYYLSS